MAFLFGSYNKNYSDTNLPAKLFGISPSLLSSNKQDYARVWTGPSEPSGMTGICVKMGEGLLCGYGDRLASSLDPPESGGPKAALEWCISSFVRFAAAFCNENQILLWTDGSAGCPLFYTLDSEGMPAFSSEGKCLSWITEKGCDLSTYPGRPLPEPGATIFNGVYAVTPGTEMSIKLRKASWRVDNPPRQYYFLPKKASISELQFAREEVSKTLKESVSQMVNGCDEVGVCLSGGVDSSTIAFLSNFHANHVRTYTIGTPYGNEFSTAKQVANIIGSEHQEFVMSHEDLEYIIPELIWALETWDLLTLQILAPLAFIYRKIPPKSVLLTGYGADLIFAGTLNVSEQEEIIEKKILQQILLTIPTNEFSPALASRNSITVRHPFWSRQMLSLGLYIRANLKVHNGIVKYILRSAVEPWLPAEVVWRQKCGIHEGTSTNRMFADFLNTSEPSIQQRKLKDIAISTFKDSKIFLK